MAKEPAVVAEHSSVSINGQNQWSRVEGSNPGTSVLQLIYIIYFSQCACVDKNDSTQSEFDHVESSSPIFGKIGSKTTS